MNLVTPVMSQWFLLCSVMCVCAALQSTVIANLALAAKLGAPPYVRGAAPFSEAAALRFTPSTPPSHPLCCQSRWPASAQAGVALASAFVSLMFFPH